MRHAVRSAAWFQPRPASAGYPPVGGLCKRFFDITVAVAAILFLSPLLVMLATLVKFSDGGRVLYRHRRIGQNGKSFYCLKYRTMVENGDEVLASHFASDPLSREQWYTTRKLQNDPRVTNVGQVLRKLSLDELPQLFNILAGDMSFVGPRPVVEDELELYGPAVNYYLKSRPGLTGLWQISGRNDVSYGTRVALDRHYIENWSFASDLKIMIRTLPVVLSSRGSY